MLYSSVFAFAALVATVAAQGGITSPQIRKAGDHFKDACGDNAYKALKGDPNHPTKDLTSAAHGDPTYNSTSCNFSLCNGIPFKDNEANVVKLCPGKQVPVKYDVKTAQPGSADMSIIDTTTNKVIGQPLKKFDSFGKDTGVQSWNIDMVDTQDKCSKPGDCVLQFVWKSNDKTFNSCVDFVKDCQESDKEDPTKGNDKDKTNKDKENGKTNKDKEDGKTNKDKGSYQASQVSQAKKAKETEPGKNY